MKNLLVLFLIVFLAHNVFAQNDSSSQKFIRSIIKEKGIVYTDSLDRETIRKIIRAFDWRDKNGKRLMTYAMRDTPSMSITFKPDEINYVDLKLRTMQFNGWGNDLLENSTRISSDTIKKIFFDDYKKYGWVYFEKHYADRYFSFSEPIFLRNNTVSLFYSGYYCSNRCGEGSFYIYLKIKGEWKQLVYIYVWNE